MGCLVDLFKRFFLIIVIIAFFALGGWKQLQNAINSYRNPDRATFVEREKAFGDFSSVSADYQLSRNFNFFGYQKITARYMPTGQKITIYDFKNSDEITVDDFTSRTIDKKIDTLLGKFKDSIVTLENFRIIARGQIKTKNKPIPFILFEANVKNIPMKDVVGILSAYSTTDPKTSKNSNKVILTVVDKKDYNFLIFSKFMGSVGIE